MFKFGKKEVLISCSSLHSLPIEKMISENSESKIFLSQTDQKILLENLNHQITNKSQYIANLIYKKYSTGKNTDTSNVITEILLARRYRAGERLLRNPKLIYEKVVGSVTKKQPILLTISLYPCKIPNPLKTAGILPDLADVLSLARLCEISKAVQSIYYPGLKIVVLMDGFRFQKILQFPSNIIYTYQQALEDLLKNIGGHENIILQDYTQIIEQKLSDEQILYRKRLFEQEKTAYEKKFLPIIRSKNNVNFLKILSNASQDDITQKFIALYQSLLYSIYVKEIQESSLDKRDNLAKTIYSDLFNITSQDSIINNLRRSIINKTLDFTINYISEISAGRKLKPLEIIYPDSIRCDMHNIQDRLTLYAVNRSTKLTSFHGTGTVTADSSMTVSLRLNLLNSNYIPIYGEFAGIHYTKQPFFYIHKNALVNDKLDAYLLHIK